MSSPEQNYFSHFAMRYPVYGLWHPQRILKKYPFWKYTSKLSKQESENKELKQQQEKFQKSEKEVEELKKSVFEKDSKIKKLNQEKAHVDSELSSRKNESEDRKNQIEILKDELEKLQNESKKVQENSSSNLTAENSEEFEKLKNENSKYAKTDNTLREAIKKLQMQLKDKRQELNLKDEKNSKIYSAIQILAWLTRGRLAFPRT